MRFSTAVVAFVLFPLAARAMPDVGQSILDHPGPLGPYLRTQTQLRAPIMIGDLLLVPQNPDTRALPSGVWRPFMPVDTADKIPALAGSDFTTRMRPGAIIPFVSPSGDAVTLWISLNGEGAADGDLFEDDSTDFHTIQGPSLLTSYHASYSEGRVLLVVSGTKGTRARPHRKMIIRLATDSGTVGAEGIDGQPVTIAAAAFPATYADGRPAAQYRMTAADLGPIFRPGTGPGECDARGAREAVVYQEDGVYNLFYDGAGPKGWLACRATSTDLVHWTAQGPVLDFGLPGTADSATATSPWSVREETADGHGLWHMFYVGSEHASPGPDYVPWMPYVTLTATAEHLAGPWKKDYEHVPFGTKAGTYRSDTASPGYLIHDRDEYLEFFSAAKIVPGNLIKRTLGLARAKTLQGPWQVEDQPIFSSELQVENSSVYYEKSNGSYFLFTNHIGGEPLADGGIGEYTDAIWVFWSKDPRHWDENNKAVVLDGVNSVWSGRCFGMPAVIEANGKLAVFYDSPGGWSGSHMHRSIGLAWMSLPLVPPTAMSSIAAAKEAPQTSHPVIDLWAGDAPGLTTASGPEHDAPVSRGSALSHQIKNVSHPTLTLFAPEPSKANGVAVIVAPGGGFRELETDKEGEKAARWLNQLGITALVLKYRIPAGPTPPEFAVALPDAQRAIRLVRSHAKDWALRADQVGLMGFSAGAQLAVAAGTHFEQSAYPVADGVDQLSCRPDFEIIVYPGGLLTKDTEHLSPDFPVTKSTPQMFIVDAETDRVDSENCTALFTALKRASVPAELHLYTLGAHGFALNPSPEPHATWTLRCQEWMVGQKILAAP